MEVRSEPRCWLVLTFGDDRSYAGNLGYDDDPRTVYRYDSDVQNHMRVSTSDVFVIRDRRQLIGVAIVEDIRTSETTKVRQRCPVCSSTTLAERSTIKPRFRCARKHEFDEPTRESAPCTAYEARLGGFVEAVDAVPVAALRAACLRYTAQSSIQELSPDAIRWGLGAVSPEAGALLPPPGQTDTEPLDAGAATEMAELRNSNSEDDVVPHGDERESVNRSIRLRRGQAAFRRNLVARYGARCMVSGCELFDIVEAAHIAPYRGIADNSPVNGLLLRSDLHTLFDLDLLAVEPSSLQVQIHPLAATAGYSDIVGKQLSCAPSRPSRAALQARWECFQRRRASAVGA